MSSTWSRQRLVETTEGWGSCILLLFRSNNPSSASPPWGPWPRVKEPLGPHEDPKWLLQPSSHISRCFPCSLIVQRGVSHPVSPPPPSPPSVPAAPLWHHRVEGERARGRGGWGPAGWETIVGRKRRESWSPEGLRGPSSEDPHHRLLTLVNGCDSQRNLSFPPTLALLSFFPQQQTGWQRRSELLLRVPPADSRQENTTSS